MKLEKLTEIEKHKKVIRDLQVELENQQMSAETKLKTSLEQLV